MSMLRIHFVLEYLHIHEQHFFFLIRCSERHFDHVANACVVFFLKYVFRIGLHVD